MIKRFFAICTIIGTISFTGCSQDIVIKTDDIPNEISAYITANFPNQLITQATKDKDGLDVSYEINLNDLTELDFNRKKEITGIDRNSKLPDSVVPEKILNYVKNNYPYSAITSWKIDDNNQEIEVDNGLDLEFNLSGDFISIDN